MAGLLFLGQQQCERDRSIIDCDSGGSEHRVIHGDGRWCGYESKRNDHGQLQVHAQDSFDQLGCLGSGIDAALHAHRPGVRRFQHMYGDAEQGGAAGRQPGLPIRRQWNSVGPCICHGCRRRYHGHVQCNGRNGVGRSDGDSVGDIERKLQVSIDPTDDDGDSEFPDLYAGYSELRGIRHVHSRADRCRADRWFGRRSDR